MLNLRYNYRIVSALGDSLRREHGRHIVYVKECGPCLYQGNAQVLKRQARTVPYDRRTGAGTKSKEGKRRTRMRTRMRMSRHFSANQKKEHVEDMLCAVYPYMNVPPLAADNKLKKINLIDILGKEPCLWLITRKIYYYMKASNYEPRTAYSL